MDVFKALPDIRILYNKTQKLGIMEGGDRTHKTLKGNKEK